MAFLETDTLGQERFSLLLLEPGEIYFEDYSVYYYPAGLSLDQAIKRKQQGHLKLCSKSIVFVPKEIQFPLLKFPLKHVQVIDESSGGLFSKLGKVIQIVTNQTVEMKEKNIVAPFVFKKEKSQHIFSLNYASVDDCLPHMCQLHRASTLYPGDQDAMLNAIMLSRQARVKFNTSWLEDIYEKIVLEVRGDRITPLATNPGRVMLTSSRLYFQPFNNIDRWPVLKLRLKDIKRLICRRFLLRQLGLEIYCGDGAPVSHLYLAFKTEELRNELYEQILNLPDIDLEDTGQADMTLRWQSGTISNFDYLLYLNSLADRSFNDLTQYPVMPWVIQNYTSEHLDLNDESNYRDLSKPIGALNSKRLETIKERMVDLPPGEPKFMYGSHYSTPGYVLFYLARIAPEYVLCLQNGKFDHPDRMFNDLSMTWNNCLAGASDFKELIPEFYSGSGEFLTHRGIINFGFRMDSRPVGDAELPPWASSASDFISKLREALESDIVSRNLHRWIDLVFGLQQRGEEAERADNLFYYLTYEGAIDLNSIKDETERFCLETQIREFGQTPKQLFTSAHPQRFTTQSIPKLLSPVCIPEPIQTECIEEITRGVVAVVKGDKGKETSDQDELGVSSRTSQTLDLDKIKPYLQYTLHKDCVTEVCMSPDGLSTFSVSRDSFLKMYSLEDQRQLRSVNMSLMALSSCEVINDKTIVVGCWDNKVYFYSIEYGRVLDTLNGHDDAVSCVRWKAGKLYTASWDSTVKVWTMDMSSNTGSFPMPECMAQLDHDEGVTCMDIDSDSVIMVSGSKDGHITLWDLTCFYTLSSILVHSGPVTACLMSSDKRRIFSCGEDGLMKGIDMETMTEILIKDLEHPICCMSVMGTASLLLSGDQGGRLCVWDMDKGQIAQTLQAHQGPVTCMDASRSGTLLTGGGDKTVILWKPDL